MQRSLFHWCKISFSFGVLACSGKLAVLSEPVDGAPTDIGSDSPVTGSLASCPDLAPDYTDLDAPHAQLIDCGVCTCDAGQPTCTPQECKPLETMGRCPENSDSVPEALAARAAIVGSTLFLDVKGYGGCGRTDFRPCYVQPEQSTVASQSLYPRRATIRVLNPTLPSDCDKVAFQSLQIGLRTLLEFKSEEGNLVDSNFGMAAVGELNCQDMWLLASNQLYYQLEKLGPGSDSYAACDTDADCFTGDYLPSCASGCFAGGMNQATFAALKPEIERIDTEICAPLAEQCQPEPGGCSPSSTTCRNGRCAQRP